MYKLLFLIYCLFIAIVARSQQHVPLLPVDPRQAYGGGVSEYIDSVEYIPLETKSESLFGDIARLIITDSSYIITDYDTQSILFFDLRGKFIRRVRSDKSFTPHVEYDAIKKYAAVCFFDNYDFFNQSPTATKTLRFYRFSGAGSPIDTIREEVKATDDFKGVNLEPGYVIKTNTCKFNDKDGPGDSTVYLLNVYRGDSLYKKLIPYNQKEQFGFCYFMGRISSRPEEYTVIDGVTYAATPVEHKIYRVTKDTAYNIFEIVFPQDVAIPKNILKLRDTRLLDSVRRIGRPPGIIYNVSNIFFIGNKLFFKGSCILYLSNVSTSELRAYNFIYDTLLHKLVALERLTPDERSSFLPVFDARDGLMLKGIQYHSHNFYSYISSLDMFAAHENTKSKNPQYLSVLQEYFKTQNRKSNPVIVRMKLKD